QRRPGSAREVSHALFTLGTARQLFVVLKRDEESTTQCANRLAIHSSVGEVPAVTVVRVLTGYRLGELASRDQRAQLAHPVVPRAGIGDVAERVLVSVPTLLRRMQRDEDARRQTPEQVRATVLMVTHDLHGDVVRLIVTLPDRIDR